MQVVRERGRRNHRKGHRETCDAHDSLAVRSPGTPRKGHQATRRTASPPRPTPTDAQTPHLPFSHVRLVRVASEALPIYLFNFMVLSCHSHHKSSHTLLRLSLGTFPFHRCVLQVNGLLCKIPLGMRLLTHQIKETLKEAKDGRRALSDIPVGVEQPRHLPPQAKMMAKEAYTTPPLEQVCMQLSESCQPSPTSLSPIHYTRCPTPNPLTLLHMASPTIST